MRIWFPFTVIWQIKKTLALKMLASDLQIEIQRRFFPRIARRERARCMRREPLEARRILLKGRTWHQLTRKGRAH